jgi:molybdopterin-guanine dinucleotide biosynthesis protein B
MVNSIKTEGDVKVIDAEITDIGADLADANITIRTNGNEVALNAFTKGILKETIYGIVSSLDIDDEIRKITVRVEE